MNDRKSSILLVGIGNPGRQDDALGILFVEEIEKWVSQKKINKIDFAQNYQLNIEDADTISHFDKVYFVDASIKPDKPFELEKIEPSFEADFTTHSIIPSVVLGLCHSLFNNKVEAYQLHIKGEKWDFMEPLSKGAIDNLMLAIDFMKIELEKYSVSKELIN